MEFSKGASAWILSKNPTFSYRLFFTKIMSEKIVFNILGKKKQLFLDQKIEVLTRAKKWTFFLKGVGP